MANNSDENLLFSMWALQIGFIDSAQMVEAAGAWMFAREKPIGQIFVEKQFMSDSMRSTIDEIVRKQVERTGSIDKSLESLSQASSLALGSEELEMQRTVQKFPKEWHARIRELSETKPLASKNSDSKRFKIKKEIGHGGLGLVSEAYDCELDRTVAIKEIRHEIAMNTEYRARFITEAKITGLLDHPGIVPVHAIGEFEDGRPFYAMRLIRGKTMSRAISDAKHQELKGELLLQRIRPLLRHLIDACYTVEYAFMQHALLHRDLKPSNIMIDRYGETIVVDWGLVKNTESKQAETSQSQMIPSHVFDSGSQPTAEGQFRGTLNYMSPEQAKGLNDQIDHRSDIYGLGATLYTILTGRAPYPGLHWDGVTDYVDSVRENGFIPLRDLRTDIPQAMEAICMKAMATKREDRYQKASELAEDIDRWIAGDPVTAYPEGPIKRMERWGRKHLTALASGIVLLTGLTLGLAWMNQVVRVERDQARASEERAIDSRKLASTAIEKVVEQIGDNSFAGNLELENLRYEMLAKVTDEISGLIQKHPNDHAVKGDLVRTKLRLANIDRMKRSYAPAIEQYRSVLALIESVPLAYRTSNSETRDEWDSYEIDSNYYLIDAVSRVEGPQAALALNQKIASTAEAYMKRNRGILPPAIAYARNQLQLAEIQFDLGKLAEAKAEVAKASQTLEPFVFVKREGGDSDFVDDPSSQELVSGLMLFTSATLLEGRCLTSQSNLDAALKKYEEAIRAAKRIQGSDIGLATGTNFLGRAYHEMHLAYLKQGNLPKAASAHENAMQILEKREGNPTSRFLDRLFILTECNRARFCARQSPDLARNAVQIAEQRFAESFAAEDTTKDWEILLYIATARAAIAAADGDAQALLQAKQQHDVARQQISMTKPNSPLLQELNLSSIQPR